MIPCIALCASHIDSPQRLQLLKCSIDSMLNQKERVPIWISISTPADSLDIYYEDIPDFHIFIHTNTKKSQFEHFWYLIQQIEGLGGGPENLDETFYIFFDDDDYSHPERTRFYMSGVDTGQNSLLATDALLMMYEPADTTHHSLESCSGEPSVNGHEYFMYCVRAPILRRFCQIILEFGLIGSPICDILLISVLFSTRYMNRSCRPLPWIYAYSIRDEIQKNRTLEMSQYMNMIQIPGLLDRLEREFQIEWYQGYRGYVSIYGHEDFIAATPFQPISEPNNKQSAIKQGGSSTKRVHFEDHIDDSESESVEEGGSLFRRFFRPVYRYWKKEPYFFCLLVVFFLVLLYFLVKWIIGFVSSEFREWTTSTSTGGGAGVDVGIISVDSSVEPPAPIIPAIPPFNLGSSMVAPPLPSLDVIEIFEQ